MAINSPDIAEPAPPRRIAILLDHDGDSDSRVLNTAHDLQRAGYIVRIFALSRQRDHGPLHEDKVRGVPRTKIGLFAGKPFASIALLRTLKRGIRRKANPVSAQDHSDTSEPLRAPDVSARTTASRPSIFQRSINSLLWHVWISRGFKAPIAAFGADVIYANDLSTLGLGTVVARDNGARLIYDAHEFECGRNGVPNDLAEYVRQAFERHFIKRCDAVITVSETIAECLHRLYRVSRPVVILNVSPQTPTDVDIPYERAILGANTARNIAVYAGSIKPGRGVGTVIRALNSQSDLHLTLIGPVDPTAQGWLDTTILASACETHVHQVGNLPQHRVSEALALADFSIIPTQDSCASYRMSLPNKFFQSLSANVPVIVTPLPEMVAVLNHIKTGHIADGMDGSAVIRAAQQLINTSPNSTEQKHKKIAYPEVYRYSAVQTRRLHIVRTLLAGHDLNKITPLPHWDEDGLGQVAAREVKAVKRSTVAHCLSGCVALYLSQH